MNNKIKSRISFGKMYLIILIILIIPYNIILGESYLVSGHVYNNLTRKSIQGANVIVENIGTYTDEFGSFKFIVTEPGPINIVMIGYKSQIVEFSQDNLTIYLEPEAIESDPIEVTANRVISGVTPVASSNLTINEISEHYSVEDVPMILSTEPGIHAYSESGNGTGYSYLSIRGFDQYDNLYADANILQ